MFLRSNPAGPPRRRRHAHSLILLSNCEVSLGPVSNQGFRGREKTESPLHARHSLPLPSIHPTDPSSLTKPSLARDALKRAGDRRRRQRRHSTQGEGRERGRFIQMEHDSPKMAPRRLDGRTQGEREQTRRHGRVIPLVIEYGLHEAPCLPRSAEIDFGAQARTTARKKVSCR